MNHSSVVEIVCYGFLRNFNPIPVRLFMLNPSREGRFDLFDSSPIRRRGTDPIQSRTKRMLELFYFAVLAVIKIK